MIYQTVQEMPVMSNDDQAALEFQQILFKNIEGYYIQVVGRLVQYQQVRILQKDSQQVQTPFFSS